MRNRFFTIVALISMFSGCVEPFDVVPSLNDDEGTGDTLVVEAIITDEVKQQIIKVSKLGPLGEISGPTNIGNAQVSIEDGMGNRYEFNSLAGGIYESQVPFAAVPGTSYSLRITVDGNQYSSSEEFLPTTSAIDNLYATRISTDSGVEGIGIFVDPRGGGETPKFRYEFEETYEIIAPLWAPFDMVVTSRTLPFEFDLVPRDRDTRRCFGTRLSNEIILSSDLDLDNNVEQDFLVQFISSQDPVIQHRYSILVSQYSQGTNAHAFYTTLKEQATSENVFSQIQPGFIEGNITNISNFEDRVIGYFSVESVASTRLFFDYVDFYPDEELPPYFINCNFLGAPIPVTPAGTSPLIDAIDSGNFVYVRDNNGEVPDGGPFLVARTPCGNCTALGSNIVPEFWEE